MNTAAGNSFFGSMSGDANTSGNENSFFGVSSGSANTTGFNNSFFGAYAGSSSTGTGNSFFGARSGDVNTSGILNAFFGNSSGGGNTTGDFNTFVGNAAATANTSGSYNTLIGAQTNVGSGNLSHATAIGAEVVVTTSDTIQLGRSSGADDVRIPGPLTLLTLGGAGATDICINGFDHISTCSSSLQYKIGVQPFKGGLNIVDRLRPIAFSWRDDGMRDIGFAAEEVAVVEPLLVTHNAKGEIEGVKYRQVTTVLVNAVKEQQAEIDRQKAEIKVQRQMIEALTKLVCSANRLAAICK